MKGHARNLMTEHVLALRPEMSLAEIARVLVAAQHGGAPVVDEHQRVIGFISEIDLLDAFLAQRTSTATARDIMSHPVLVADEFMPVDEVMSLLREGGIHHLPVVRQERLVGIITPHDVLAHVVEHDLPTPPEDA
jgi:CBS domain-containing protein